MTIISYAQNFEDVMLWRALKHIKHGFYIDVGAAWPELDSVTNIFYTNGWSGVNIEPNPALYSQLQEQRTRDTNLRIAISNSSGVVGMNFIGDTGLSTADNDIADQHVTSGWNTEKQQINTETLEYVWKNYIPSEQEIHFLKIDVEGFEKSVLEGNCWSKLRPWIIIIEATAPLSTKETHEDWENIITSNKYQFAYADGLNRFYVASEHIELLSSFKYPPNVFDDFLLAKQHRIETEAHKLRQLTEQTKNKALLLEGQIHNIKHELNSMLNSRSWMITAPMRWFGNQTKIIREQGLFIRTKFVLKTLLSRLVQKIHVAIKHYPKLRLWLAMLASKLGCYSYLKNLCNHSLQRRKPKPISAKDLGPEARKIYQDLKAASLHPNINDK